MSSLSYTQYTAIAYLRVYLKQCLYFVDTSCHKSLCTFRLYRDITF